MLRQHFAVAGKRLDGLFVDLFHGADQTVAGIVDATSMPPVRSSAVFTAFWIAVGSQTSSGSTIALSG